MSAITHSRSIQAISGVGRTACAWLGDLPWRAAGVVAGTLGNFCGSRAGERFGILTYHRVSPPVAGLPAPEHNVPPRQFARQLHGLLRRGMQPLALRDALQSAAQSQPLPRRAFVVTLDDGYASVYQHAWPILRELRIPATIFVSTSFLDRDDPFPFDAWGTSYRDQLAGEMYRPLTRPQCRELLAGGLIELGAHTHTHEDFRGRPHDLRDDLQVSLGVLRDEFGIEQPSFAFPFGCPRRGFAGSELVAAVRQTSVRCGLTTETALVDPASDPFGWGRFNVFPWDTPSTLAGKLGGWYAWAPRFWQRLRAGVRPSA